MNAFSECSLVSAATRRVSPSRGSAAVRRPSTFWSSSLPYDLLEGFDVRLACARSAVPSSTTAREAFSQQVRSTISRTASASRDDTISPQCCQYCLATSAYCCGKVTANTPWAKKSWTLTLSHPAASMYFWRRKATLADGSAMADSPGFPNSFSAVAKSFSTDLRNTKRGYPDCSLPCATGQPSSYAMTSCQLGIDTPTALGSFCGKLTPNGRAPEPAPAGSLILRCDVLLKTWLGSTPRGLTACAAASASPRARDRSDASSMPTLIRTKSGGSSPSRSASGMDACDISAGSSTSDETEPKLTVCLKRPPRSAAAALTNALDAATSPVSKLSTAPPPRACEKCRRASALSSPVR
eukprot:m.587255 g.587255  ORF g.587255 m.587255 type:complete len:354 (-) comp22350_c1_seq20:144-1205(-)